MRHLEHVLLGGAILGTMLFAYVQPAIIPVRLKYTEVQVDYDSGMERRRKKLGPMVLSVEMGPSNSFTALPLPNGKAQLTGKPDWRVAARFHGNSRRSANYQAGVVLQEIHRLDGLCVVAAPSFMRDVKKTFLMALAAGDISGARDIARSAVMSEGRPQVQEAETR